MEQIGKSFIMVIEPLEYSIHKQKFNFETLGLVFGTQSMWFRDKTQDLVTLYLKYWQQHFSPKVMKEIQDNISNFINARVKGEEIIMRFYCALGLLAYYNAVSHDKSLVMRKFSVFDAITPAYYAYIGVNEYSVEEILIKMEQKVAHSNERSTWKGSCFGLVQVPV